MGMYSMIFRIRYEILV